MTSRSLVGCITALMLIACAERDGDVRVRVEPLGLRAGILYDVYLWAQRKGDPFRFDLASQRVGIAPSPNGGLDSTVDCNRGASGSPVRLLEVVARRADVDPARKEAVQSDIPEIFAGTAIRGADRYDAPHQSALLARDTKVFVCPWAAKGSTEVALRLGVIDPTPAASGTSLTFDTGSYQVSAAATASERGDDMDVQLQVASRSSGVLPEVYLIAEPNSGVARSVRWRPLDDSATLDVSFDLTRVNVAPHVGGRDDHSVIRYRGLVFFFDATKSHEFVSAPVVPHVGAVRARLDERSPALAGLDVVRVVAAARYAPDRFGGATVGRFSNCEAAEIPTVGRGPGVEVYLGMGLDPASHSEYPSDYYWAFGRMERGAFVPIQAIGAVERTQPGEFFVLIRDWRDPGRVFAASCGFLRDTQISPVGARRIIRGPGSDLPSPCDELAPGSRQLKELSVEEMLGLLSQKS